MPSRFWLLRELGGVPLSACQGSDGIGWHRTGIACVDSNRQPGMPWICYHREAYERQRTDERKAIRWGGFGSLPGMRQRMQQSRQPKRLAHLGASKWEPSAGLRRKPAAMSCKEAVQPESL
ncbi:hypothetical protein [Parapedobacter sp. DT-150]|uniref:hypothetical protein n=1 Tax=Parapedobacter sp. DT-150 TaxID=3396162 RepID=UPI003F1932EE